MRDDNFATSLRGNRAGYFPFPRGFNSLKGLCMLFRASRSPMRLLRSAFLLPLALVLAGSLAHAANVSRSQSLRRHERRLQPVSSTHLRRTHAAHVAGHHRAAAPALSRVSKRTVTGRRFASRAARLRAARLATARTMVASDIPAVPLKHWVSVPALVGSHESLVRQNYRTEADGLERIEDDAQLNELLLEKALVQVPVSAQLRINDALPVNRRFCRPWTAEFLVNLARAHAARFHRSLIVTSAVRTVEYQRSLMLVNGNAAPADGDIASPHLSGATIDIAKKGLTMSEISWMRAYLLPLEQSGKIDVEEEFKQSCFHITVYKSYAPSTAPAFGFPPALLAERVR